MKDKGGFAGMPKCWFCGEEVPKVCVCPKCGQEFCDAHAEPLTHDCFGVPIETPLQIFWESSENKQMINNSNQQCWFCGTYVSKIVKCPQCHQSFCSNHESPSLHDCPGFPVPNPLTLQNVPNVDFTATLPAPPESFIPHRGKIECDASFTQQNVETAMEAYNHCVTNPDLPSDTDPELGKILLENPNVLWLVNSCAMDDAYAQKLNQDPFMRGLLSWMKAQGSRLEFIQQICDDLGITDKELSLHKLLNYYFTYVFDASHVIPSTTEKGFPIIKRALVFRKKVILQFMEHAREGKERIIGGYLIGRRDVGGGIQEVTGYNPLPPEDNAIIERPLDGFFEEQAKLTETSEEVVGFVHSQPFTEFPIITQKSIASHFREKMAVSALKYFKEIKAPVASGDVVEIVSRLCQYEVKQMVFLLNAFGTVAVSNDLFGKVTSAIFLHTPDQWDDLYQTINSLLQPHEFTRPRARLEFVPYAGVIISPMVRLFSVTDFHFEMDQNRPNGVSIREIFYQVALKMHDS